MFFFGLQAHQVNHVDEPNLEVGELRQQQVDGGERLEGRNVAGTGHDHVGLDAAVGRRPFPDADAGGAVAHGGVHVQVLQRRLLTGDDDIDIVATAQTVVHYR